MRVITPESSRTQRDRHVRVLVRASLRWEIAYEDHAEPR